MQMQQRRQAGLFSRIRENGLRQTAVEIIGGRWYQRRNERIGHIIDTAYQRGPALVSPEMMLGRIGEIDRRLVDLLVQRQGWRVISGSGLLGSGLQFTETDRLRVVWENRYHYHYDVQIQNAVQMWTDFGFGQTVKIEPSEEAAREVWEAFWSSPRNAPILKQRKLHKLSNIQVVDGEQFFEFSAAAAAGGSVPVIRRVATDEIKGIIYEEGDKDIPLFYVRETDDGKIYYPDFEAKRSYADKLDAVEIPEDARRADQASPEAEINTGGRSEKRHVTDVVMQHVTFNEVDGRGWPQFMRVIEWSDSLRTFLGDRMTIAKAVAAFVDEVIVDGGSRGIDAVKSKFASSITTTSDWWEDNPPAAAGSQLMHNKAVEYKRRPLTTGASDAEADAMLVVGQVSAGTKIPPHYMGFPGAMQNRATARESSRPFIEQMERYQTFWTDVFQEWVEIVLWFDTQYGGKKEHDTTATITLQSPLDLDMVDVTALITAITSAQGAMSAEVARLALDKLAMVGLEDLGIRDLEPVALPEGVLPEEPPEEEPGPEAPEAPEVPDMGSEALNEAAREMVRNVIAQVEWALETTVDRGG